MEKSKLDINGNVVIPCSFLPIFRTSYAIQEKVEKKLLFRMWGGLGDQVCAEPTIRYATKMFKECDIFIETAMPELFAHLNVKKIFDTRIERPNYKNFFVFETITPPDESNMVWQFFSHMLTNCVDFPSMCALRLQLPTSEKEIKLTGIKPENYGPNSWKDGVVIHPGKHWQSKTFPKEFWNAVIYKLLDLGITPIIIGADSDDNRGTVAVDASRCIDLRNKLSIPESVFLLQNSKVLLTNDSSPLHFAASGNAWIGCVATVKHPDMISHWRNGQWQWREKFFNKSGLWDIIDFCPNKEQQVSAEFVPPEILDSWLPDPTEYALWAWEKSRETKI